MKTLMKTTLAAALSIAAISPAIAGEKQIVVESQAAMQQWQKDVGQSLDRRLETAERQLRARPVDAIVQVRFTLDASGKPDDITVFSSSGDSTTDTVAKRAVRGLTQIADAPVSDASARTFQANIIFANDARSYRKLAKALNASEKVRMARADSEGGVISFGL